jgi:hypothetical protein
MTFVENHREFETLLRKTLVGTLNGVVTRYHRIIALSMEERFRDIHEKQSQLINQIPHKDIANYLRMDPTNFSKLLNSIPILVLGINQILVLYQELFFLAVTILRKKRWNNLLPGY